VFVVKGKGGLLKTQDACLWGLVKPCQVRAPAEMLEVGKRGRRWNCFLYWLYAHNIMPIVSNVPL
ncbi:hypothetical protein, partial [Bartonella sp. CE47NXGY]|uniref:hypothetical protein n=1 Tax=Bartonella sp. CE47NXGY TaxID=3243514 RepID=UPI0035D137AC